MPRNPNEFVLHLIPPPRPLNWSCPRELLIRTFFNHLFGDLAPIGHVFVEFGTREPNAHGVSRVLTGMSRLDVRESSREVRHLKLGLGSFFHDFRGRLDDASEALEEIEWARSKGRYAAIRVPVSDECAQAMMQVLEGWIANGAFRHYGGGHVVTRGTGSGCAEFAMFFLSMALGAQATHPSWWREVLAPKEFVGGPMFNGREVSLLTLLLFGDRWAVDEEDGVRYRTPDPELMFNWVLERARERGDESCEVVLTPSEASWTREPALSMRFEGGYPHELPEVIAREWAKVRLK